MTYRERMEAARREAMATGRTVKVELDDPLQVREASSLHDTPCVCGPYDRCSGVRMEDARRAAPRGITAVIRAQHRAYND